MNFIRMTHLAVKTSFLILLSLLIYNTCINILGIKVLFR